MQITLLVPFIAIIFWKLPLFGILLCLALVLANGVINFMYANKYELKIGILAYQNWYLLQSIVSKPWTKLAPIGAGIILAYIYTRLVHMR